MRDMSRSGLLRDRRRQRLIVRALQRDVRGGLQRRAGDMFLCGECSPLPPNATRRWVNCDCVCDAGFYSVNGTCAECASGPCPPGYNRSACTDWADTNCDAACEDPSKPPANSEWASGCEWA